MRAPSTAPAWRSRTPRAKERDSLLPPACCDLRRRDGLRSSRPGIRACRLARADLYTELANPYSQKIVVVWFVMGIMLALWSRLGDGRNGAQVPKSSRRSRVMWWLW